MLEAKTYTPEQIREKVATFFKCDPAVMDKIKTGPIRADQEFDDRWYRHVYIYCLQLYSGMKKVDLARMLGFHYRGINTSTHKVIKRVRIDQDIRKQIAEIEKLF
jgi:hypothetical protein